MMAQLTLAAAAAGAGAVAVGLGEALTDGLAEGADVELPATC
jgi:hypothetical protein